jgi:hypothetical protein
MGGQCQGCAMGLHVVLNLLVDGDTEGESARNGRVLDGFIRIFELQWSRGKRSHFSLHRLS